MDNTGTIEADKTADTTVTDETAKAAETAKDTSQTATTTADDTKATDKAAASDGAAKEFVADPAKTDEENAKALADFEAANAKDDKKPGLPDDWRDIAAAGDEATLKLLRRYGSISGVAKALKEAQDTIRSGKIKQPMPDPKDEKAMAEWRKSNGVPDDPTGYKLPDTVVKRLTDDDKPMLSSYTDYMHKKGATPDEVARGTEWYIDTVEAIQAKQAEDDKNAASEAEDILRKDWAHGEFKANTTIAKRWADTIPGLGENVLGIRAPDGRLLGNIPEFISWAAEQGRDKFGDVAFSTTDSERKFMARKEEIEKIRDTDFARYEAEGLSKELVAIREKEMARKR